MAENSEEVNSTLTISQIAVLNAQISLLKQPASYTETLPDKPGNIGYIKQENALEGLNSAIENWRETADKLYKAWYEDEKNEILETAKMLLEEDNGKKAVFEINFQIDWDSEVHTNNILPDHYPVFGNKSSFFGSFSEKIVVTTNHPEKVYNDFDPLVKEINEKMNRAYVAKLEKEISDYVFRSDLERFERDVIDIPERIRQNMEQYVDPPDENVVPGNSDIA
jgi:hypothetical protein